MKRYVEPGEYIAVCVKTNFDGHYTKRFKFPGSGKEDAPDGVDASWYFLNRVDFIACIEAVYPAAIFGN